MVTQSDQRIYLFHQLMSTRRLTSRTNAVCNTRNKLHPLVSSVSHMGVGHLLLPAQLPGTR